MGILKPCECGRPGVVAGFCRTCFVLLPEEARLVALRAAYPESFRSPNRRLEWKVR